jgi:hypothetical protein
MRGMQLGNSATQSATSKVQVQVSQASSESGQVCNAREAGLHRPARRRVSLVVHLVHLYQEEAYHSIASRCASSSDTIPYGDEAYHTVHLYFPTKHSESAREKQANVSRYQLN